MKKRIVMFIVLMMLAIIVSLGLTVFVAHNLLHQNYAEIFGSYQTYLIPMIITGFMIIGLILDGHKMGSKRVLEVNASLENSRWMRFREFKKNTGFQVVKLKELSEARSGIPIYAEKKRGNLTVVIKEPIHTLVIGSTGSGKTTSFVSPTAEILTSCKDRPSIVLTDPKGELFKTHAKTFRERGYKVDVIDLSDAYRSSLWNPLNNVIKKTDEIRSLKVELKNGRYYVGDTKRDLAKEAEEISKERIVELENDCYLDIQDLIYAMCPIQSKTDPAWQTAARDFIFGITLALWEDMRDGLLAPEKFNLYNIYKTITDYADGECEVLKAYISTRSETSRVHGLVKTILVSVDRTLASYLGEINRYVSWLADDGITAMTAANELDFSRFDEEPHALFLIIPDHRDNRYRLVTLFIEQMYKSLVEKATENREKGRTQNQELLRFTYFLMDEFGNLPELHNLDKIITVGRGRHIIMIPVIQDYAQLDNIYGKQKSDTIRSNCNIQIYIGSNDKATREAFSELCGRHKVKQVQYSENKEMSVSTSANSVPLIYPSDLERLNDTGNKNFGNMIVVSQGNYPIKSKMTPIFNLKELFGIEDSKPDKKEFIHFDEVAGFNDIALTVAFYENDEINIEEVEARDTIRHVLTQQEKMEYEKQEVEKSKERIKQAILRMKLQERLPTKIVDEITACVDMDLKKLYERVRAVKEEIALDPFLIADLAKLEMMIGYEISAQDKRLKEEANNERNNSNNKENSNINIGN